jgi:hypothetical protein
VKSLKNYVILLLLLTTAVGGAYVWQQYQELIKLRAAALTNDERADWQKRLWAAEKRRHELEDSLASLQAKSTEPKEGPAEEGPGGGPAGGPGRRRGNGGNGGNMAANFMAMMDKPEIQKLMAIQQRGALDSRYAALFKNLNLTPEQLDKFKSLLVEKQTALADVLAAARAQGIDPRTDPQEFRKLVADTQAEVDTSIKTALGDAGFAQYQQYQQTLPQRNAVTQLEQSLSYTSTPLTSTQAEQMVQILASNSPASTNTTNNRATVAAGFGFGANGPSSPITNAAITQSATVLSSTQVQALQQLQQTQQAQQQLQQAMRNQFNGQNRAATPATPAVPTVPGTKPGG